VIALHHSTIISPYVTYFILAKLYFASMLALSTCYEKLSSYDIFTENHGFIYVSGLDLGLDSPGLGLDSSVLGLGLDSGVLDLGLSLKFL